NGFVACKPAITIEVLIPACLIGHDRASFGDIGPNDRHQSGGSSSFYVETSSLPVTLNESKGHVAKFARHGERSCCSRLPENRTGFRRSRRFRQCRPQAPNQPVALQVGCDAT